MSFKILTDSCCDLSAEMAARLELSVVQLSIEMDGNVYTGEDMSPKELYDHLRGGKLPKTSAVNPEGWAEKMRPILGSGEDLLVLAFSSGLSATYQSAVIAAEELRDEFPDRKLIVIDTLCASRGQGLLVHRAAELRDAGKSIEETAAWVEEHKLQLCHWVTVEDLMHLKRGGRIGAATAVVGTMLNIKPIITVQDGKVESIGKARGPKAADKQLRELVAKSGGIDFSKPFCAAYSGLEDDNLKTFLAESRDLLCNTEAPIACIGSVIGTHAGPGAVAVAFFNKKH